MNKSIIVQLQLDLNLKTIQYNGGSYIGELNAEGFPEGIGEFRGERTIIARFKNGVYQIGEEWYLYNSTYYRGEFLDDAYHGWGAYMTSENVWKGKWEDGKLMEHMYKDIPSGISASYLYEFYREEE